MQQFSFLATVITSVLVYLRVILLNYERINFPSLKIISTSVLSGTFKGYFTQF